jgi:hypothetical protein
LLEAPLEALIRKAEHTANTNQTKVHPYFRLDPAKNPWQSQMIFRGKSTQGQEQ